MHILDIFIDQYNNSINNSTIDNDVEFMNPFIMIPAMCGVLAISLLCCYSCGNIKRLRNYQNTDINNENERVILVYNQPRLNDPSQSNNRSYNTIDKPPPYIIIE